MSFFKEIEKKLETVFEGIFKKGFAASIQPIEIAKEAAGVMEDQKIVGEEIIVPARYDIYLSSIDLSEIKGYIDEYRSEIKRYLESYAERNGYRISSKVEINFTIDEDIGIGYYHIVTPAPVAPEPKRRPKPVIKRESSTMIMSAEESEDLRLELSKLEKRVKPHLKRINDGTNIPLSRDMITIGRSKVNDLAIENDGVSRKHAEIIREGDGFIIIDLGSTNGTFVNGEKITSKKLSNGDEIELSKVRFRFISGLSNVI